MSFEIRKVADVFRDAVLRRPTSRILVRFSEFESERRTLWYSGVNAKVQVSGRGKILIKTSRLKLMPCVNYSARRQA